KLPLSLRPRNVITSHRPEQLAEQRINALRIPAEDTYPVQARESVGQSLRAQQPIIRPTIARSGLGVAMSPSKTRRHRRRRTTKAAISWNFVSLRDYLAGNRRPSFRALCRRDSSAERPYV